MARKSKKTIGPGVLAVRGQRWTYSMLNNIVTVEGPRGQKYDSKVKYLPQEYYGSNRLVTRIAHDIAKNYYPSSEVPALCEL